jgi:hypothetical protein
MTQKTNQNQPKKHSHGLPRVMSETEDNIDYTDLEKCIVTQKQFKKIARMFQKSANDLREKKQLQDIEEKYKQTNINNIYDNK